MAKFGDILTTEVIDTGTTTWDPVMCKVVRSVDVSMPNSASEFAVTFGTGNATEEFKTVATMHNMATNADRIVCTRTGAFIAKAYMYMNGDGATAGNPTYLLISVTTPSLSSTVKSRAWLPAGYADSYYVNLERMFVVPSDVNTYVTMTVINQSGIAVPLKAGSWLSVRRMAKLTESDT